MENREGISYHSVRNTLFNYYASIYEKNLYYTSIVLSVIQIIQMFSFSFDGAFPWGDAGTYVHYISTVRTLGAGYYTYSIHQVLFWFAFVFLAVKIALGITSFTKKFLILALFVIERHRRQLDVHERIMIAAQFMHHVYLPFIYLPSLNFFGYMLECTNGNLTLFPTVACWGTDNITTGSFAVIGLAVSIIVAGLNAMLYVDWAPAPKCFASVTNARLNILYYGFATTLTLINIFIPER